MKKFLLSMAAVLTMAFGAAAETTINGSEFTANGDNATATKDGYTVTIAKGDATNAPALRNDGSVRVYAKSTVTISGGDMKSVVFTLASDAKYRHTSVTANVGTIAAQAAGDTEVSWSGNASSVTFTVGEKAIYGTDGETKAGQLRFSSITISGEAGSVTPDPEPTPDPEVVKVGSVAEMIALADGVEFETTCTLQVGFKNYSNVFVCDPAGDFIQIYAKNNVLNQGDVIPAGLKGSYKLFNGTTPEIENATIPEATAGTFVPKTVAAKDVTVALVNSVIEIKNVVLAEASPATKDNFTGTSDGVELSLRNNYTLESVAAGTYDIVVVVTNFKGDASLYVTKFTAAGSDGIADVAVDENAPVEYYNLQGVRVANPTAGEIVIRRQGNSVSKVLVK